MIKPSRKWSQQGFSIIELLLVIAVLAILAALLFPLFTQSKRASYRVRCLNNLRQFSAAFALYANDWDGIWPCPGGKRDDQNPYGNYWSQSGPGGLNPYIRNNSIWCCPLMPPWESKYPARTYTMNSYLRETPLGQPDIEYPQCTSFFGGIHVNKIHESRRTVLLFEGLPLTWGWEEKAYYVYIYRCCNWTGVKGYYDKVAHVNDPKAPWHDTVNNYLYCDGHVVSRRPGRRTVGELSTYREMRDWYVDKAAFERMYDKYWSAITPRD